MKQTYNNRGWIEWAEVPEEDTSNVPEVSPKVFREMKQKYEEEGKQVMIIGEYFYGALLLVDGEYVAKRIKPEVWETCYPSNNDSSESQSKADKSSSISKIDYCTSDYIIGCICAILMTFPVAFVMYLIFAAIHWFLFGETKDIAYNELGKPQVIHEWFWYLCVHWWYIWTFVNIGIWTYIYRLRCIDPLKRQYIVNECDSLMRRRR